MKSALKKLSVLSVSVAALVALGLVALAPRAGHADAAADGFTLRATAAGSADGGIVNVAIDVGPEYKWNKDYPAKVEVLGDLPAGVAIAKRLLKASEGGIAATEKQATAAIPWTGTAATGASVTVQARFSICNDRVCLMKNAKVEVPLGAK
jgi:hypothetical protein